MQKSQDWSARKVTGQHRVSSAGRVEAWWGWCSEPCHLRPSRTLASPDAPEACPVRRTPRARELRSPPLHRRWCLLFILRSMSLEETPSVPQMVFTLHQPASPRGKQGLGTTAPCHRHRPGRPLMAGCDRAGISPAMAILSAPETTEPRHSSGT